jgi:hypothetical protein
MAKTQSAERRACILSSGVNGEKEQDKSMIAGLFTPSKVMAIDNPRDERRRARDEEKGKDGKVGWREREGYSL